MLFQTPTQFIVLALMLLVGFVFGLAAHTGGRKWRKRYEDERAAHALVNDQAIADRKATEQRLAASEQRVRELESEQARLRAAPVAPVLTDAQGRRVIQPSATAGDTPAGDDLGRIRGLDRSGAERLRQLDITRFADIERLSAADEAELERRIGAPAGYIASKQWREQATLLREGRTAEFDQRFGGA